MIPMAVAVCRPDARPCGGAPIPGPSRKASQAVSFFDAAFTSFRYNFDGCQEHVSGVVPIRAAEWLSD
jgi:hypothetical protein